MDQQAKKPLRLAFGRNGSERNRHRPRRQNLIGNLARIFSEWSAVRLLHRGEHYDPLPMWDSPSKCQLNALDERK
jgi:hypothetical protein